MKEYSTSNIRNIALASHSGSGKSMLAESLLYFTGALTRLGEINAGTTVSGVIIPVDSVAGAEVGTELAWQHADDFNLPRFVVINMMDRENANFQKALESVRQMTSLRLIPLQLPW